LKFYDKNGDGSLSFEEFIDGLREPLNDRRKKISRKAFNSVARDDVITASDFLDHYNASEHPQFKSGKKTRDQIMTEVFQRMDANRNGKISKKEFYTYYADVSMTYTHDQDFVNHLESVWSVVEDDDSKVFIDQLKHLTSALRLKLRTMANGTSEEYVLRGIFKDFDINKSGSLTIDEFNLMLIKLAIQVDRKYATALFKRFDTNDNGSIDFDEFSSWIIYDAYK
jgi:Ca2+-binding EF-hand superfamily protein